MNIGCGTWTTLDESGLTTSYTIYRDSDPVLHTFQVLGLETTMDAGCAKTFEPDPVTAISQLTCDNSADCHTIRVDATLAQEYTFNLKVTVWGVVHTSTN